MAELVPSVAEAWPLWTATDRRCSRWLQAFIITPLTSLL